MRASMRDALSSWPAAARAATRARGRAVAPFVQTRHRSSGKVLGEEEKAAENVVKCCSLWSCASGALFGLLGAMLSELFINWAIYTNKVGASPATALSLRTQPLQAEGLAQAIANMESAMEQEVPEGEEPKSGVAVVADLFSLKNGPPADSLTGCVVLIGAILCYWLLVHNMDMCHLMNMG
ncbi:hypothetical protein CFC21_107428 [Triticum aestivum]|uniref:Uncharacterized protein n=2 Tax=Triticum aestivum TaxID=4565 RepID=A0A9R1NAF5_WHEAT|nr:uncharacterized protein LOC123167590 isoform X3 [Triticum aestivum]KAF7106698.1 hypothetical protein CFC21_107417 [Triticum aestivum]KAF7106709.1 hypothetical protein CFC21_107428 [Triticum aestivum]